ncbi:MAG TPA: GIY-YIG nuclease family protein [Silvibacterium sp.]|nr:GIY-YIG nuclease family protein [Silvibacterium sp.]
MARDHIYYTYIMASASRTLYVGVTNDIERRVRQHKNGTLVGFTSRYRCSRLVWFERFGWVDQAIAREKEVKGWLRARKIDLIEEKNSTWVDLSEEWGKPIRYEEDKSKADPSLRSG